MLDTCVTHADIAVRALAWSCLALMAGNRSEFKRAIPGWMRACEGLRRTGQKTRLRITMLKLAVSMNDLGDFEAGMKWNLEALQIARRTGWPTSQFSALAQVGSALVKMGKHDLAAPFLREAEIWSGPADGYNSMILSHYLAEVEFAAGRLDSALARQERLGERAKLPRVRR